MIPSSEDEPPLVSVVIPVHNGERYLEQTVRSALAQTFTSLEVLVVDDGSSDGSLALARAVAADDDRVIVHATPNSGAAAARNTGVDRARGAYLAFLDHDDVWYPTKIERQVEYLTAAPDVVVVGCRMRYLAGDGRELGVSAQVDEQIDQPAVRAGTLTPFPTMSAAVFRTSVIRDVGGFPDLFGRASLTEDLYLYARAARVGTIACLPDALGAYRVHAQAARSSAARQFLPAIAYTQRALADESFVGSTPWPTFVATYRPSLSDRRRHFAHTRYRLGAQDVLGRRWLPGVAHLALAAMASPVFVFTRLRSQLTGAPFLCQ